MEKMVKKIKKQYQANKERFVSMENKMDPDSNLMTQQFKNLNKRLKIDDSSSPGKEKKKKLECSREEDDQDGDASDNGGELANRRLRLISLPNQQLSPGKNLHMSVTKLQKSHITAAITELTLFGPNLFSLLVQTGSGERRYSREYVLGIGIIRSLLHCERRKDKGVYRGTNIELERRCQHRIMLCSATSGSDSMARQPTRIISCVPMLREHGQHWGGPDARDIPGSGAGPAPASVVKLHAGESVAQGSNCSVAMYFEQQFNALEMLREHGLGVEIEKAIKVLMEIEIKEELRKKVKAMKKKCTE
ncbi:hypothetical protein CRG98_034330 [Punica granatum]|uniref:Uncharacterized protein n=1 Tax=Punica granatum TaxID=22663 RepID=A0A2I0INL8_PUNGR|nr:hypothetical protein CRG98_034330 [Punica granatum]